MSRLARALCAVGCVLFSAVAVVISTAQAKETVKIAFIGPLTGGNSAAGLGPRNSAMLAVQQKNADPNARFEYEMTALDDECKPNVGIQVATKVAADKSIIAALPHYCSAVGIATVDIYNKFGLPVVFWGAILPAITYGNDYPQIHRVSGTMISEVKVAAEFLAKSGYKRIAVVQDTTDYGNSFSKYFNEEIAKTDAKILAQFPVSPDQQDLTAELTKIKELKPDLVFLCGLTPLGVRLRTQMERVGLNVQFAGVSGIMTSGYLEGAKDAAEGTVATHNGAPIDSYAGGAAFLEAYKAAGFREDPDAYGPFAYAATNLVMDAIEKVGPDRKKVTAQLNGTKGFKSLIGEINFDDHRQNIVSAHIYVVQDGKWTYWPRSEYATGLRKLKQ
ncbi:branched-chain amino acid ABC transporter substrate-binding protein [Roseixanthobacter pseudopolyaromaticivorans]|uniref:branched-chain amino acid ABC transporter substrate-binding protein n=1 Tax=Xanthobacteraceae TaxID=335928 RepID=UPI00372B4FA9